MTERRELTYKMNLKEIFKLTDGRTVLAGTVEDGQEAILLPGSCSLFKGGERIAEIDVESELFTARKGRDGQSLQAVGTLNRLEITTDDIATGEYYLTGRMRMRGHRHLIGIESPPHHFVADRMSLGPRLPEGWDGDSWTSPDESEFFLRAWNKATGRCAIAAGGTYEQARTALLDQIKVGGTAVLVAAQEVRGG